MTAPRAKSAADTSVIVAAFASWHQHHGPARVALDETSATIAHCLLESYSVLTRLPAPHRVAPDVAAMFLGMRFSGTPLVLPAGAHRSLVSRFAADGIAGGAVYDALVGATAAHHGLTLVTLDTRAEPTYARVRATVRRAA